MVANANAIAQATASIAAWTRYRCTVPQRMSSARADLCRSRRIGDMLQVGLSRVSTSALSVFLCVPNKAKAVGRSARERPLPPLTLSEMLDTRAGQTATGVENVCRVSLHSDEVEGVMIC